MLLFIADSVSKSLLQIKGFEILIKTMKAFPLVSSIKEYGCWALCNMSVLGRWAICWLDSVKSH